MGGRMSLYLSHLHGQTLAATAFDRDTDAWVFTFSGGCALRVAAPWRMVSQTHIAVGHEDDGQWFGLKQPFDAREHITGAVAGQKVTEALVKEFGDLDLRFSSGSTLQVFNSSSGFEGWQLYGPGERHVVAQGGGRVVDSWQNS
jgi:hypothetical protein